MPWRRRCIGAGAAADSLCCCWESALSAVLMPQLLCPFLCRLMRYTATQNRCKRVSCATRARFCNRTKPKHSPKPSRRHPSHAPSDSSVDDAKTLARRFGCCERVGVGFGTWTSSRVKPGNQAQGASGGKRARQVLLREGRGQEPHEVMSKFKVGDFDWPYCRAALRVVDDARVAGGIAANGMNIYYARPRRRVAGKTPMITPTTIRHPMLSSYDTGESCS